MKTKSDYTISIFITCLGTIVILPLLVSGQGLDSPIGVFGCILLSLMTLVGIWKIESYEIRNKKIIKRNFLGLMKTEYSLNEIVSLNTKFIKSDMPQNPLNILKLFINAERYLNFHIANCEFKGNSKMKIDSRSISTIEYNIIIRKIKSSIKLNKTNSC
ncbi:hypothetical protein [Mangrovimonas sp. YM274]|uniref:hypothetical protein n=1 Tax=Mangrovimonas sp. YM274 TaxID=3070660 RepID=UPI0027DB1473|nr:hypothetical protein [Mangrovimonas sp. YM274]WMI68233.1 hypothetical protein RBH95_13920 [Mangrovimonas sp. YM274]